MMKYRLIHPQLLGALGRAGHGSRILIADSNYPHVTGAPPATERVFLNLAPGLISATDILKVLLDAIPVETAYAMLMADGQEAPIVAEFRAMLPTGVEFKTLERSAYYDAVKSPDTILVIATGEQRLYANLLLVVGVVTPEGVAKF
ncbi:MAG TPA: RbsD/FucU family protein [Anaerolineales bacterium]|nr:RbsD/FucU family protein [Anaerolineales bacterium]